MPPALTELSVLVENNLIRSQLHLEVKVAAYFQCSSLFAEEFLTT